MTDESTPSPAPKRRRKAAGPVGPWPVSMGMRVLEKYGISTLALIALAWFTATYMIRPLVDSARSSMESVAEKVGAIESIFRESERLERDQSARSTAAIEALKTEISVHRQQAAELRDTLLAKILDAQPKELRSHEATMERLLRDAVRGDSDQCEFPQGSLKGIVVGPEKSAPVVPVDKKGDG